LNLLRDLEVRPFFSYLFMERRDLEIEHYKEQRIIEIKNAIDEITGIFRNHNLFWKNATGWAPDEANAILMRSRLDWLQGLTEALYIWIETYRTTTDNEGKLIIAWTNLGAVLEGALKLFLSIHYIDYRNSKNHYKNRNGIIVDPDELSFEKLKVFIQREKIFDSVWIEFIQEVQKKRNAIHAYKDRDIGNWHEFYEAIARFRDFSKVMKKNIPMPY